MCDIANESFALGEKIPEAKLVSKTLRSLPQRFAYKVTAIEEAKNIETMRLDELMGSLRTFEMNLSQNKKENEISQGIAFQAEVEDNVEEKDEDLAESLAQLTKNFIRMMKKFNEKNQTPTFNNSNNFQKNKGTTTSSNNKKKIGEFNVGSAIVTVTFNLCVLTFSKRGRSLSTSHGVMRILKATKKMMIM